MSIGAFHRIQPPPSYFLYQSFGTGIGIPQGDYYCTKVTVTLVAWEIYFESAKRSAIVKRKNIVG
ncbi:MAG: hypothetical protein ABR905_18500 [Terracidiphilus sp.]